MSSCCGEQRSRWLPHPEGTEEAQRSGPDFSTPRLFEYTGKTALSVTGPYSGKAYRFDAPGARVEVDGRDVLALSGIPVLTIVNQSS